MMKRMTGWMGLVLVLAACSDDAKPKTDARRAPDLARAEAGAADQGAPAVDQARRDRPLAREASAADQRPRDLAPDILTGKNDRCLGATPITLTDGKATVSGTTVGLTNEFSNSIKCGSYTTYLGPQAYYSLPLSDGKRYLFKVTVSFTPSGFYLFSASAGCQFTGINLDCGSGGTTGTKAGLSSSTPTSVTFQPAASGVFLFAIDSTSNSVSGTFSVDIEELPAP